MAAKRGTAPPEIYGVLDANALLPPRLSDVLFDMHGAGLFKAKWSREIEEEFERNWASVVAKNQTMSQEEATAGALHRLHCYQRAVPEYAIYGHLNGQTLATVPPKVHKGDKHVAAAALHLRKVLSQEQQHADVYLVSSNIRHLASKVMQGLDVTVIKPGNFIDLFASDTRLQIALERTVNELTDPPYSRAELLGALLAHESKRAVEHLAKTWGVAPVVKPREKK